MTAWKTACLKAVKIGKSSLIIKEIISRNDARRIVGTITFNSSKSILYIVVLDFIFRLNKIPVRRIKLVMPKKLIVVRVILIAVEL